MNKYDYELAKMVDRNAQIQINSNPLCNKKIARIKAYRAWSGAGLFEAKAWVERHFENDGWGDAILPNENDFVQLALSHDVWGTFCLNIGKDNIGLYCTPKHMAGGGQHAFQIEEWNVDPEKLSRFAIELVELLSRKGG